MIGVTHWIIAIFRRALKNNSVLLWAFDSASPTWWKDCNFYDEGDFCPGFCYQECLEDNCSTDPECRDCIYYDCNACQPDWIYLYRGQTRVNVITGKLESVVFLDTAYQTNPTDWRTVCNAGGYWYNYRLPPIRPTSNYTSVFNQAVWVYTAEVGCYRSQYCSMSHGIANEIAAQCNANFKGNGFPSTYFCGVNTNTIGIDFGCSGSSVSQCSDFKFTGGDLFCDRRNKNRNVAKILSHTLSPNGSLKSMKKLFPNQEQRYQNENPLHCDDETCYNCAYNDTWRFSSFP